MPVTGVDSWRIESPDAAHRECSAIIAGRTRSFSLLHRSPRSPFVTPVQFHLAGVQSAQQRTRDFYRICRWLCFISRPTVSRTPVRSYRRLMEISTRTRGTVVSFHAIKLSRSFESRHFYSPFSKCTEISNKIARNDREIWLSAFGR